MSDQQKKKVKVPIELDYMKLPDHIWEKHLTEFIASMNGIEQSLGVLTKQLQQMVDRQND